MEKIIKQNQRFKQIIKDRALEQSEFLLDMEDDLINDIETNYSASHNPKSIITPRNSLSTDIKTPMGSNKNSNQNPDYLEGIKKALEQLA